MKLVELRMTWNKTQGLFASKDLHRKFVELNSIEIFKDGSLTYRIDSQRNFS
jgi:hypothetical protein